MMQERKLHTVLLAVFLISKAAVSEKDSESFWIQIMIC